MRGAFICRFGAVLRVVWGLVPVGVFRSFWGVLGASGGVSVLGFAVGFFGFGVGVDLGIFDGCGVGSSV